MTRETLLAYGYLVNDGKCDARMSVCMYEKYDEAFHIHQMFLSAKPSRWTWRVSKPQSQILKWRIFFFQFLWSHNQSEAIVHLTEHKAIHLLLRFNLNTVAILCANIFSFSNISLRKLYRTCFICMIRALRKVYFRLNFAIVALLFSRLTFILSRWSCFMQKQSHPWGW